MATHAEVIANSLAESGVEFVFGVPGGEVLALIDACRRAGLRFLLAGHETSAAVMAQVVGQIRGVPGVCVATLGPGATNLVTGVAGAFLDRAPLVAVTAQIPGAAIDTMTHQRVYVDRLFAPITKRCLLLGDSDSREAHSQQHAARRGAPSGARSLDAAQRRGRPAMRFSAGDG